MKLEAEETVGGILGSMQPNLRYSQVYKTFLWSLEHTGLVKTVKYIGLRNVLHIL